MAWVPLKQQQQQQMVNWVKIFTGSWIHGHSVVPEVGCRLWRLPPSWFRNDWSEVAEVMAVRRWFQSLMVRGKKELNRTG